MRNKKTRVVDIWGRGRFKQMPRVLFALVLIMGFCVPIQAQRYYYQDGVPDYGTVMGYSQIDSEKAMRDADKQREADENRQQHADEKAIRDQRRDQEDADRKARAYEFEASKEPMEITVFGYVENSAESRMASIVESSRQAARAEGKKSGGGGVAAGMTAVSVGNDIYQYSKGLFYKEVDGKLTPADAPIGAMVFNIPSSCKASRFGDATVYEFKGAYFTRSMFCGAMVYEVIPKPESVNPKN